MVLYYSNSCCLKNMSKDDKASAISFYEKYLQEQKMFKNNLKKLKRIKGAQSLEEILLHI